MIHDTIHVLTTMLRSAGYANFESLPTLLIIALPFLILEKSKSTTSFFLDDRFFKMNKVEFYEFMIVIEDKVWKVNNVTNYSQQIR